MGPDPLPCRVRLDIGDPLTHSTAAAGKADFDHIYDRHLHNMVAGLPGMKLMRRRGENEPED